MTTVTATYLESLQRWTTSAGRWVKPSPALVDDDDRFSARLLASLSLFLLPVWSLQMVMAMSMPERDFPSVGLPMLCTVGAYALGRAGYHRPGALLLVAALLMPTLSFVTRVAVDEPGRAADALWWLGVPIVAGGLLLPVWLSVVVDVLILAGLVAFPTFLGPYGGVQIALSLGGVIMVAGVTTAGALIQSQSRNALRTEVGERRLATAALTRIRQQLDERVQQRTDELRRASEMMEAVVESSPAAVVVHDHCNQVLRWNPAAARLFGWGTEEVIGKPCPLAVVNGRSSLQPLKEWLPTRPVVGAELRLQARDGGTVAVSVSSARIAQAAPNSNASVSRDVEPQPGSVVVLADISHRELMQNQLRRGQRLEAIGRLAGSVAHDFNNLLAAIAGNVQVLLADLDESDPDFAALTAARNASADAARLTKQLLAFSRRQVLTIEPLEINELVRNTSSMLGRLVDQDVVFDVELGQRVGTIQGDRSRIEQMLVNLVVNANEAVGHNGRVTVRTRPEPGPPPAIVVEVADNGAGMSPEVKDHIFEPFFTTKPEGQGAGLGLATVYGSVTQMGGRVDVVSEPGAGTTVRLFLPQNTGLG